jgi:GGDEF domain-containing protein
MKHRIRIAQTDVDRREFHLTIFVCSAIVVLAFGLAVLMYPAVFANQVSQHETPRVAFFGFCGLSCLLVVYIVDRQITIRRLRHQIAIDRIRASEALNRASADLLETLPNFNTFEDRLSMEFRRAATAKLNLSVLVIAIKLRSGFSEPSFAMSALGDAAKAISRRLREKDSIYNLRQGYIGVILPGVNHIAAKRVSARLAEGLFDAAGANDRFSFVINSISYPEQTTSAHDLELAVCGFLPEDLPKETLASDIAMDIRDESEVSGMK